MDRRAWAPCGPPSARRGVRAAFATALAYIALAEVDAATPTALGGRQWFASRELANGSWANDPYQTALAVRALPWGAADTDGDHVLEPFDNCDDHDNGEQIDNDGDGPGDACEGSLGRDSAGTERPNNSPCP